MATPLWVQEAGPGAQLSILVLLAIAGPPLERARGWRFLLGAFLAGAVAGEVSGYAWNPHSAGVSVAVAGVVTAALYVACRDPDAIGADPRVRIQIRVLTAVAVAGGIVLCALADNHGPALLAGFAFAALAEARSRH